MGLGSRASVPAGVNEAGVAPARDAHDSVSANRDPWGSEFSDAPCVPLDPKDAHAGKIRLTYEIIPRRDQARPLLGTIVAVEGGPGYSTTGSRSYYRDLFDPLLGRRRLLLVDNRGTGKSGAILCKQLQAYRGDYIKAVGKCGRQLGDASDLYGSAFAADDLAAVLDHLGIEKIDLYGDSHGTFFS